MKHLLRLIKLMSKFTKWVILSILLGFFTIASSVGLMGTSAYLISRAALQPSIAVLQVAIVGVRFFGISRGIFRYFERLVSHSVNLRILSQLRHWFYNTLEPLLPASALELQSGDLLERMLSDVDVLENFYIRVVSPVFIAFMVTAGMGFLIGQFHWQLAWVTVCGLMLSGITVPLLSQILRRKSGMQVSTLRGELSAAYTEQIQGMREILLFQQESYRISKLDEIDQRYSDAQTNLVWREAFVECLNTILPGLTLISTLIVAVPLVHAGQLDGVFLAVISLMVLAGFEATTPLGTAAQNLEISLLSANRLFSLLQFQPEVHPPAVPLQLNDAKKLEMNDLSFSYRNNPSTTLREISFELVPGKKLAILGASGAGKSTLLNLLLRFWDTEPGRIQLNGIDIHNYHPIDVRRCFTLISTRGYIFNQTLRQNLLLAKPNAVDAEMIAALQMVQLGDWFKTLPQGLETWLGEWGQFLSGGEKQRLLIARGILQNAPLWLLDEPTVFLDAANEKEINELLWKITKNHSVIWISHRPYRLEEMDEILILQEGHIIERGSHQELMKLNGYYAFQHNWLSKRMSD